MSKYNALTASLLSRTGTVWNATFPEIEQVLGFSLPKSARSYAAWWSNNGQPHSSNWTDAGWRVEDLNLTGESLTFRKTGSPLPTAERGSTAVPPTPMVPPPPRTPGLARVDRLLTQLAVARPVFHSEADFQHALAWVMHEVGATRIRLERRYDSIGGYLDLLVQLEGQVVALELKHWTRALDVVVEGEHFQIKDQSAQDISRYDYVRDVVRLEKLVAAGDAEVGYAITLTNDQGYWNRGRGGTIDEAFRLHEGEVLEGTLAWAAHAGGGTTKNREAEHRLMARYPLAWRPYSQLDAEKCGEFRYLALEVRRERVAE